MKQEKNNTCDKFRGEEKRKEVVEALVVAISDNSDHSLLSQHTSTSSAYTERPTTTKNNHNSATLPRQQQQLRLRRHAQSLTTTNNCNYHNHNDTNVCEKIASPRRGLVRSRSYGALQENTVDSKEEKEEEDEKEDAKGRQKERPEPANHSIRRKSKASTYMNGNSADLKKETSSGRRGRRRRSKSRSRPRNARNNNDDALSVSTSATSKSRRGQRHRSLSRGSDAIRDNHRRSTLRGGDDDDKDNDNDDLLSVITSTTSKSRRGRRHRSLSRGSDAIRDNHRRSTLGGGDDDDKDNDNDDLLSVVTSATIKSKRGRRHRSLSRGSDAIRDNHRRSTLGGGDDDDKDNDNDDLLSVVTSATIKSKRGRRPRQKKQNRGVHDDAANNQYQHKAIFDDRNNLGSSISVAYVCQDDTADDVLSVVTSTTTTATKSRRGRRPHQKIHRDTEIARAESSSSSSNNNNTNDDAKSLESCNTNKREERSKHLRKKNPQLSHHILSNNRLKQQLSNVEEATIESSGTPILLQFDPTIENLVQTVNQSSAKKVSEKIRRADGTESEFHIKEVKGLPTFERKQQRDKDADVVNSTNDLSANKNFEESNRSILSSNTYNGGGGAHENWNKLAFLSLGKPKSLISTHDGDSKSSMDSRQYPTEASEEGNETNYSRWQRTAGELGNNLQVTRSRIKDRIQKGKLLNRPLTDDTTRLLD